MLGQKSSDWLNDTAVVKHFRAFGDAAVEDTQAGRETAAFGRQLTFLAKLRKVLFGLFRSILSNSEATSTAKLIAVHVS